VLHSPARASSPRRYSHCLGRGREEERAGAGGTYPDPVFHGFPAPSGSSGLLGEPRYVEAQAGDWLGDSKSAQSQIKWLNRNWIQLVQPCGF